VRAVWNDERGKWQLELKATEGGNVREWTEECDLFLNGTGFLKYTPRKRDQAGH